MDADFAGNWRQADAHIDPMTSKSHSGWIVHFAGPPHYLGVKNANHHGNVHHRGGIHSPIHQFKGGHPHDGDPQRSKRAGAAGRLPASQSPLHALCLKTTAVLWSLPAYQRYACEPSTSTSRSTIFMNTWNART